MASEKHPAVPGIEPQTWRSARVLVASVVEEVPRPRQRSRLHLDGEGALDEGGGVAAGWHPQGSSHRLPCTVVDLRRSDAYKLFFRNAYARKKGDSGMPAVFLPPGVTP